MQRKDWVPLVVLLVLVVANFAFDWKRRLDFEWERQALSDHKTELTNVSEKRAAHEKDHESRLSKLLARHDERLLQSDLILHDIQQRLEEQARILAGIRGLVDKLQEQLASAYSASESSGASSKPDSVSKAESLLNTGLEEILANEASWYQDSFEARFSEKLDVVPNSWPQTEHVINDLQSHYGVSLSSDDKQVLRLKIDTYRHLYATAVSSYYSALSQAQVERLDQGKFIDTRSLKPRTSGDLAEVPEEGDHDVFAVTAQGNFMMKFRKEEFPELYRKMMVGRYIPRALVDDLTVFCKERSSR